MNTLKHLVVGLACGALLSGCTGLYQQEVGQKIEASKLEELKVGQTTEQEIISMFGQPMHSQRNSDGTKMLIFRHGKATLGNPWAMNAADRIKSQSTVVTVWLDKNGKYEKYSQSGNMAQ